MCPSVSPPSVQSGKSTAAPAPGAGRQSPRATRAGLAVGVRTRPGPLRPLPLTALAVPVTCTHPRQHSGVLALTELGFEVGKR